MFIDKLNILNNLLKEMYKNKVDAKITVKGLIKLLDETDELYKKESEKQLDEMIRKSPKVEINKGE